MWINNKVICYIKTPMQVVERTVVVNMDADNWLYNTCQGVVYGKLQHVDIANL